MYDIIIIGGGPAGLNAALYAGRGGMKTLLIEKLYSGGQAATTYEVDNYIGFSTPISGPELVSNMEAHAKRFGVEIVNEAVSSLSLQGDVKTVSCDKNIYQGKTVILAMGANPRELGLDREHDLRGNGVSYCATCDGAFFRNRPVAVVGGGDTAVEDALFLSRFCTKIYLIHRRDKLRAAKILSDKLNAEEKIQPVWDSVPVSILGDDTVKGIRVQHVKTGETSDLDVNAIFVAVGTVANNDIVKGILPLDEAGYIVTDENMATSVAGVFAAGDIRKKSLRQIITAAADGAIAANSAINYLMTN